MTNIYRYITNKTINITNMKAICLTVALFLTASLAFAQDNKKGEVSSFYEKNAVLDYNDGKNAAGEIGEQPKKFDKNFHIYLCLGQSNMEGNRSEERRVVKECRSRRAP